MQLCLLSQQLINRYQKGFPLCPRPFLALAEQFEVSEEQVISCLEQLKLSGVLSRLGPVFDHKKAGASTLAAIEVPSEQLEHVANIVSQYEQVNHNYAREHQFNLWFVLTAEDQRALQQTILDIEQATGFCVLVLPMEKSYHIDLAFDVCFEPKKKVVN